MPATRGKNFRSGDLAEQLGLFLLQSVSLVAPIPRTEDVGIDVVCTLIQEFNQYNFIAANSFYVSIKSSNIKSINFQEHEVKWLANLELPFMIASVDKKEGTIELYCVHRLYNAFATNHNRNSITLHLADLPSDQDPDFVPQNENNIYIGPCIMKWSLDTLNTDSNFQSKFFNIVKKHIDVAKNNIQTYSIGFIEDFIWETNKELKKGLFKTVCADDNVIKGFEEIDEIIAPYLFMWLDKVTRAREIGRLEETIALLQQRKTLIEDFKKLGL